MGYLLALNRTIRGKLAKDATPGQWARYNDAFTNVELTAAEIAAEIRDGYAIAAQHNGRRKQSNWRLAQHIGVDLDNGALSWDEILAMPLVEDCAAIVHTTASHTPDNPRYRVLFLLEDVITNPASYTAVVGCMLQAFGTADPHCKDASRLFFGAPDCSLLLQPGNRLTNEDIANLVTAYPADDWLIDPAQDDRPIAPDDRSSPHRAIGYRTDNTGPIVPPDEISPARLAAHSEALLDKIRYAPDGTKWATLTQVSYIFGGYVKAGYYKPDAIEKRLKAAIETRRATVASMPAAHTTIEKGLEDGATAGALYYRQRGEDTRTPPPPAPVDLRPRIAEIRRQVTQRRIDELEAAIMAADMEAVDLRPLVDEYDRLQASI